MDDCNNKFKAGKQKTLRLDSCLVGLFFFQLWNRALSLLRPYNIPISYPHYSLNGSDVVFFSNKPAIMFDFLRGSTPKKATVKIMSQLGTALAQLHSVPVADFHFLQTIP